jgi:hypothetical protein
MNHHPSHKVVPLSRKVVHPSRTCLRFLSLWCRMMTSSTTTPLFLQLFCFLLRGRFLACVVVSL